MHKPETPNIANQAEKSVQSSADALAFAKHDRQEAMQEIQNPQLQILAQRELQEAEALEEQMN